MGLSQSRCFRKLKSGSIPEATGLKSCLKRRLASNLRHGGPARRARFADWLGLAPSHTTTPNENGRHQGARICHTILRWLPCQAIIQISLRRYPLHLRQPRGDGHGNLPGHVTRRLAPQPPLHAVHDAVDLAQAVVAGTERGNGSLAMAGR